MPWSLFLTIHEAKNLPKVQIFGKQDPYCRLVVGNQRAKTNVDHNGGKKPRWEQILPFDVPSGRNSEVSLKIIVMDEESIRSDREITRGEVSLIDLAAQSGDKWYPLNKGHIRLTARFNGRATPFNEQEQQQPAPAPQQPQQGRPFHQASQRQPQHQPFDHPHQTAQQQPSNVPQQLTQRQQSYAPPQQLQHQPSYHAPPEPSYYAPREPSYYAPHQQPQQHRPTQYGIKPQPVVHNVIPPQQPQQRQPTHYRLNPQPIVYQPVVPQMPRQFTAQQQLTRPGQNPQVQQPPYVSSQQYQTPLPEGWIELTAPDGKKYYQNNLTRTTQWDRPQAPPTPALSALPEGWEELTNPDGKIYYFRSSTGTSQWHRPEAPLAPLPEHRPNASAPSQAPLAPVPEHRPNAPAPIREPAPIGARESKWNCDMCSYLNPASNTTACLMCGTKRTKVRTQSLGNPRASVSLASRTTRSQSEGNASTWNCRMCSFRNDSSALVCQMCRNPKSTPNSDKWACKMCTFVNDKNSAKCGMCNTRRS